MQTYFEVNLPICNKTRWMNELKSKLISVPVRWQNGHYHITLAFLNDSPKDLDVPSIIGEHMVKVDTQELSFDKLDVFTATSANLHIVNLTVTSIPDSFKHWVDEIRADLIASGCKLQSSFRLHVTLGRVDASAIDIDSLRDLIETVNSPCFSLPLKTFDYREYRGETIKQWNLIP